MERKTISAHELNKYAYCPYQWYYERLYGRKELRKRYQERNERLGLTDSMESRFRRGEEYHKKSYFLLRVKRIFRRLMILLFAAMAVAGYVWVKYRYGMA